MCRLEETEYIFKYINIINVCGYIFLELQKKIHIIAIHTIKVNQSANMQRYGIQSRAGMGKLWPVDQTVALGFLTQLLKTGTTMNH